MFENRFEILDYLQGQKCVKDHWRNAYIFVGSNEECLAFLQGLRAGIRL